MMALTRRTGSTQPTPAAATDTAGGTETVACRDRAENPLRKAGNLVNLGAAFTRLSDPESDQGRRCIESSLYCFGQALEIVNKEEHPEAWAEAMVHAGRAKRIRISGDKGANIEDAIVCFKEALTVYTRRTHPKQWADVNMVLGRCYGSRNGPYQVNIACAIRCFRDALVVYERNVDQEKWALLNMLLGIALTYRVRNRSACIEEAVACLRRAVSVMGLDTHGEDWITSMEYLGYALHCRIEGVEDENLQVAIFHYNTVLQHITQGMDRVRWFSISISAIDAHLDRRTEESVEEALVSSHDLLECCNALHERDNLLTVKLHRRLGTALLLSRENNTEDVEVALLHFRMALGRITNLDDETEWVGLARQLGNAYAVREDGDTASNLELALRFYKSAFVVVQREPNTREWATLLVDIARVYEHRVEGDPSQNQEQQIVHLVHALSVFTREEDREEWAALTISLGLAFGSRSQGDQSDNTEKALLCFTQALSVITKDTHGEQWADLLWSLGEHLTFRSQGNASENVRDALEAFQNAEGFFPRDDDPCSWALLQLSIGCALAKCESVGLGCRADEEVRRFRRAIDYMKASPPEYKNMVVSLHVALASALLRRTAESEARNVEDACVCLREALRASPDPRSRCEVLLSLGEVLLMHSENHKDSNVEEAIMALTDVVEGVSQSDPMWTSAMCTLGLAYKARDGTKYEDHVDDAIYCYREVLDFVNRDSDVLAWCDIMRSYASVLHMKGTVVCLEDAYRTLWNVLELTPSGTWPWMQLILDVGEVMEDLERLKSKPNFWPIIKSFRGALTSIYQLDSSNADSDESDIALRLQTGCIRLLLEAGSRGESEREAAKAAAFFKGQLESSDISVPIPPILDAPSTRNSLPCIYGALVCARVGRCDMWQALQWVEECKYFETMCRSEPLYNGKVSSLGTEEWNSYHDAVGKVGLYESIMQSLSSGVSKEDVRETCRALHEHRNIIDKIEQGGLFKSRLEYAIDTCPVDSELRRSDVDLRELVGLIQEDIAIVSLFFGPDTSRNGQGVKDVLHGFAMCGREIVHLSHGTLIDPMSSSPPLFNRTRVPVVHGPYLRTEEAFSMELLHVPDESRELQYMDDLGCFLKELLGKLRAGLDSRRRIVVSLHRGLHAVPISLTRISRRDGEEPAVFQTFLRKLRRKTVRCPRNESTSSSLLADCTSDGVFVVPSLFRPGLNT